MPVSEDFLHYLWEKRLFSLPLKGTGGEEIEVLDTGTYNADAGPDFFNARIRTGGIIWAGNVEIHLRSSDWNRHDHQRDPSYDNVILHLVLERDAEVFTSGRREVLQAQMRFSGGLAAEFDEMKRTGKRIPCLHRLHRVDGSLLNLWLERLAAERLEMKARELGSVFRDTRGDWEETAYRQLARNFGNRINTLPFSMLAKSLPFNLLRKHIGHLRQTEALLFGQAGYLGEYLEDPYHRELSREYLYLSGKYGLHPVNNSLWKYLRLRPANFPSIRIAQLAGWLYSREGAMNELTGIRSWKAADLFFSGSASGYWEDHYLFGKFSSKSIKRIGREFKKNLLINTVVPLHYLYALRTGLTCYRNVAFDLLETLPPERNALTESWVEAGLQPSNAFITQGLLQLTNNYCIFRKCLSCEIGKWCLIQARTGTRET